MHETVEARSQKPLSYDRTLFPLEELNSNQNRPQTEGSQ